MAIAGSKPEFSLNVDHGMSATSYSEGMSANVIASSALEHMCKQVYVHLSSKVLLTKK